MRNHLEEKFRQLLSELKTQNENHFEEFVLLLAKKGKEFDKKFKNISDDLNTFKIKSQQQTISISQLEMKLTALLIKDVSSNPQKDNEKIMATKPQGSLSIPPTGITTVSSSTFVTANPIGISIHDFLNSKVKIKI